MKDFLDHHSLLQTSHSYWYIIINMAKRIILINYHLTICAGHTRLFQKLHFVVFSKSYEEMIWVQVVHFVRISSVYLILT